jgi:hypothetical protein
VAENKVKDSLLLADLPEDLSDLFGPKVQKMYRGAYRYQRNNSIYTEESFEVYRDKKELTFTFISEVLGRVSTGELLKIHVTYQVGKDFVPQSVTVRKELGKEQAEELYRLDAKQNMLKYTFKNKRDRQVIEMNVPPRFHICTPTMASSMTFFLSKKFDATSKNFYTFLQSYNSWNFEKKPSSKGMVLERLSLTSESIFIDGHELQAVQYKLSEDSKGLDFSNNQNTINSAFIYLSRFHAIPYSIRTDEGSLIQIKYFNNLIDED